MRAVCVSCAPGHKVHPLKSRPIFNRDQEFQYKSIYKRTKQKHGGVGKEES